MWRIDTCDELASTQDAVRDAYLRGDAGEGYCLRALRQSGGRGRQGRVWIGLPDNLFFSFLVEPAIERRYWGSLSLLAGVALAQAVTDVCGAALDVILKWPNDLMLGDYKCAGILVETEGNAAIIGVGVNVTRAPEGFSALGGGVDANDLLEAFLRRFEMLYARWRDGGGFAAIRGDWLAYTYEEGALCGVKLPSGAVQGRFAGLDENGALLLAEENGAIRTIVTGDIVHAAGD